MGLIPKHLKLANLYEQDGEKDPIVHIRIANLFGPQYWLILEYDPDQKLAFGFANLGDNQNAEIGYINIKEIENLNLPQFVPALDLEFTTRPLSKAKAFNVTAKGVWE